MVATLLPSTIDKRWTSRKLWLSIFTAVFVILNSEFGWLSQAQINDVIKIVGLFVSLEGAADIVARLQK